jgi:hypothetical protein
MVHRDFAGAKDALLAGWRDIRNQGILTTAGIAENVKVTAAELAKIAHPPTPAKSGGPSGTDTLGGDDLKDPKGELQKQLEFELAQFRLEEAKANENEEKIVEIKRAALARVRELFGEHSKEYLAAATDLEQELNKGQKEGEKIFADIRKDGAEQEKAEMEERKHRWQTLMTNITSTIETSFMGIVQGTQTISQAFKNIFKSMLAESIAFGVKTLIAHKAAELAKTGATAQGTAQRVAMEQWAAVKSVAIGAWSAIARIGQYAVEGAAAAFKAIAAIPIIGPHWRRRPRQLQASRSQGSLAVSRQLEVATTSRPASTRSPSCIRVRWFCRQHSPIASAE